MQKTDFTEALDRILSEDAKYPREAYHFLREALDFTTKHRKKGKNNSAHISGQQLLEGIRLFALREFGPMVPTVFAYWNILACEDFGKMVFNLIDVRVFGKTEDDSIEDFKGAYTFEQAFVAPYLPEKALHYHRVPMDEPAGELS